MKQFCTHLLTCLMAGMMVSQTTAQVGPINIADLNAVNRGSNPEQGIRFANGTKYMFTATSTSLGQEPWITDGTTEGTYMLSDFYPGRSGSSPRWHATDGNIVYFVANNRTNGEELFKTDGTPQGTRIVKDIRPGFFSSFPNSLVYVNRTLFFLASDPTGTNQLWKSDGTEAGTTRLRTDSNFADVREMTAVGNTLFFWAYVNNQSNNMWLWKTDGTQAGTVRVELFGSGVPSNIQAVNNKLLFARTDDTYGNELWVTDGNGPSTLLKDIEPGSLSSSTQIKQGITIGNTLYFSAFTGQYGSELWKTDGTPQGTMMVKDIFPGARNGAPNNFAALKNGTFLFQGNDSLRGDGELWKSDGTEAGTQLLKVIGNPVDGDGSPEFLISDGSTVYFSAYQEATGYEFWKSDGTAEGTVLVTDLNPGDLDCDFEPFTTLNNKVVFKANNHPDSQEELFVSDGTQSGTRLLKAIGGTKGSDPKEITAFNGDVYFTATAADDSYRVYKTNGNANNLTLMFPELKDPTGLTVFEGKLFFYATTNSTGGELHRYDPLTGRAELVQDLHPGGNGSNTGSKPVIFQNQLYFTATTATTGNELYKSDGSTITLVSDIVAGDVGSEPDKLTVMGNYLYFAATDSAHGTELWRTDGTTTELVVDVFPGTEGSWPYNLVPHENALYMIAQASGTGTDLYKVVNKTATLIDLDPNSTTPSNPLNLTAAVGSLFFNGITAQYGYETYAIRNDSLIFFGDNDKQNNFFGMGDGIEFDGHFYVSIGTSGANPSANDSYVLWRSDGRTLTRLNKVIPTYPQRFVKLGCNLFFKGVTPATEEEIWMLKKGEDTATLAIEMIPGPVKSDFNEVTGVNGALYFTYNDTLKGKELWKYIPATAGSSTSATICFGERVPFNGADRTESGAYQQRFTTREGCDSLVTLNLTVRPRLEKRFPYTLCYGSRLVVGDIVIEDSGAYTAVIKSVTGCDSTLILDVSLTPQINNITINGSTITAVTDNAVYRWVTCPDYAPATGNATSKSFTPESDGSYAVIVQDGACVDTSACVTVSVPTGLAETNFLGTVSVYPNPNNGTCYVTSNRAGTFKLINQLGQTLQEFNLDASNQYRIELKQLAQGMYFITGTDTPTHKVVVDK